MNTEIYEYIRKRKHKKLNKVGVILATLDPNSQMIKIGWSKCNTKAKDVFSTEEGLKLARKRTSLIDNNVVPSSFRSPIRQFGARCIRYFKQAKGLVFPI